MEEVPWKIESSILPCWAEKPGIPRSPPSGARESAPQQQRRWLCFGSIYRITCGGGGGYGDEDGDGNGMHDEQVTVLVRGLAGTGSPRTCGRPSTRRSAAAAPTCCTRCAGSSETWRRRWRLPPRRAVRRRRRYAWLVGAMCASGSWRRTRARRTPSRRRRAAPSAAPARARCGPAGRDGRFGLRADARRGALLEAGAAAGRRQQQQQYA